MSDITITNSIAKAKLIEEWFKRKGDEPWDLAEIAELIADATWLAEERIIKLLEGRAEGDLLFAQNLNTPSEDVAYTMFKGDVIALIKGENK